MKCFVLAEELCEFPDDRDLERLVERLVEEVRERRGDNPVAGGKEEADDDHRCEGIDIDRPPELVQHDGEDEREQHREVRECLGPEESPLRFHDGGVLLLGDAVVLEPEPGIHRNTNAHHDERERHPADMEGFGCEDPRDRGVKDQDQGDEHHRACDDARHRLEFSHPVVIDPLPASRELSYGKIGKKRGKELVPALHHIREHGDRAGEDCGDDVRYPEDEVHDEADKNRLLLLCKGRRIENRYVLHSGRVAHMQSFSLCMR